MKPAQITEQSDLEAALQADRFLLFKHSLACPVSAKAFAEYEAFVERRGDFPTGWIDVVAQRPWSQWVAGRTGIPHQSPQALVVRDGKVVWDASHFDITVAALEQAVL